MKCDVEQGLWEWDVWTGISCMFVKDWHGFDDGWLRMIQKVSVHLPHARLSFPPKCLRWLWALWIVQWCNVRCCSMVLLLYCQIWFQSSLRMFLHSNCDVQPNNVFWQHSGGTAGRFAVCVILCLPTCTFSFRSFLVFFPIPFFCVLIIYCFCKKARQKLKNYLI